jgi:hypothetical protein
MFFRREKPHVTTFEERLACLKQAGFETRPAPGGGVIATQGGCAAVITPKGDTVNIGKAGVLVDNEIAMLVHGGYQMFLRTPSGRDLPAQASHLKALHAFDEDLREALGLTSLYNLSLGTTCDDHLYDRVEDRDAPKHPHPWEKSATP